MSKLVMMTGGGTAGHVTPNLALLEPLRKKGYRISYIGRKHSIEEQLAKEAGLPFYPIAAGRLHRDFNLENWVNPWKNIVGAMQAAHLIKKEKPALLFCKGGFVSVPVAMAGKLTHTPVVLHESDFTPGLANRLCVPFADKVCVGFEETLTHMPKGKATYTGTPIRAQLARGSREKGYALTGLRPGKPVVLIMGGSTGAGALNEVIGSAASQLTKLYEVVHLCGRQEASMCKPQPGYCPLTYAGEELADLYAMADLVVSRAGANALAELLWLHKPAILVPLPKGVSRGDQILNARSFEQKGYAYVLPQEKLTAETLMAALAKVHQERDRYISAMKACQGADGTKAVMEVIENTLT